MTKIKFIDKIGDYKDLIISSPNKYQNRHRWFNLVESYSSELVRRIIGEQEKIPTLCLDPFGGTGTTALTCQFLGIQCHSIEHNPFFYDISRAKLNSSYDSIIFSRLTKTILESVRNSDINIKLPILESKTLFPSNNRSKWLLNKNVAISVFSLINRINNLDKKYNEYKILLKLAVATMLIDISNVFRNGKCLSYRENWKERIFNKQEIYNIFEKICQDIILPDLRTDGLIHPISNNYSLIKNGDSRKIIEELPNNEIDLVITSPPYLNSRDYTDVYRLELWIMGYITKYMEETEIRKSSLTSHVQVPREDQKYPNIKELKNYIKLLENMNGKLWNKNIPNMVKGYFNDIETVLTKLNPKLKVGAKLYINVSNSAYGGHVCEVDKLIALIAETIGYKTLEIRITRYNRSSSQQKLKNKIRESIVVLKKY